MTSTEIILLAWALTSLITLFLFTICGRDRVQGDPDGTYLADVVAALAYADYTIRELRKKSGWNDPALMMFVQDQARQTVLSLPFFPGS
jgi:hypothetical protein